MTIQFKVAVSTLLEIEAETEEQAVMEAAQIVLRGEIKLFAYEFKVEEIE